MKTKSQKIELVANVLIILVALLFGGVLIQKYLLPANQAANQNAPRLKPSVGATVNLPGENWSRQPKTLVLALQASCRFCNESAPFYKRIIDSVGNKPVRLVAVFPTENQQNISHLKDLGLSAMEVRQSSLDSLQVGGTPTLMLTNDKGEITDFWVGKLTPEKEAEVLTKLNS